MKRPGCGLHVRFPRIYASLKRAGHDSGKAIEILLDASRSNKHSLMWIRAVRRTSCK